MPIHPPSLKTWSARPVLPDGERAEPTAGRVLVNLLGFAAGVAALLFAVAYGEPSAALLCGLVALVLTGAPAAARRRPPDTLLAAHLALRLVLVTTLAVVAGLAVGGPSWWAWLAAAAMMVTACGEPLLAKVLGESSFVAAHLPGVPRVRQPRSRPGWTPLAWWAALLGGGILAALGLSPAWWLVLALLACAVPAVSLAEGLLRVRGNARVRAGLARAVRDYEPEFLVYAGRPDDASYQVTMWLDYLRRTGRRFLVVARAQRPAGILAELTSDPVIHCPGVADIERILVPSLRAAFYVNASSANGQLVRYQHLDHIYLGHGDSDKAPSYNPTHAMYDYIFAAGQAAVDRYPAHGVAIDPDKFVVVGRPQIEDVDRVSPGAGADPEPVVLYAPTWRGHVDETLLYSLPHGERIVQGLLDHGATVIFRPHPFNLSFPEDAAVVERIDELLRADAARTGRAHLFGDRAQRRMSIVDCFNSSTALVSDVSSVVSDYLYSGKPYAMYSVAATPEAFVADFPVARGAYILDPGTGNLDGVLTEMLGADPLRAERAQIRTYYLGDFPDEGYSEVFVDRARRVIDGEWGRGHRDDRQSFDADEGPLTAVADDGDAGAGTDGGDGGTEEGAATEEAEGAQLESDETEGAVDAGTTTSGGGGGRRAFTRGEMLAAGPVLTGVAAVALGASAVADWLAVLLVVLSLGLVSWSGVRRFPRPSASALSAWPTVRVLIALAVFFLAAHRSSPPAAMLVLVAAGTLFTIVLEGWVRAARGVTRLKLRNLPTLPYESVQPAFEGWMFLAGIASPWALTVLTAAALPIWFGTALAIESAVAGVCMVLVERRLIAAHHRALSRLKGAIEAYRPEFVVYFASRSGADYQAGMWMPYFERIGRRFIVVSRYDESVQPLAELTDSPVILCRTLASLEDTLVPTVRAAFYVNNGVTNTHYIEHRGLTHIWLNHGDSEKPACFNPVHAIYDRIFAAGQAGVDRYARHGVEIPREKFEIVGRPQVSGIAPARGPIAENDAPTVLYAPTWVGPYADSRLYSLPQGEQIVRALLERGCTVVFRAHPLNYQYAEAKAYMTRIRRLLEQDQERTGRAHLWGADAEQHMSLTDCFNASDAMVSDVSAVVTDYLQSGKPFAMVAAESNSEKLIAEAPVAVAAYPLMGDLTNLEEVLDDLLVRDPLVQQRRSTREYYLGCFPDTDPAEPFLRAARHHIDAPTVERDALATP